MAASIIISILMWVLAIKSGASSFLAIILMLVATPFAIGLGNVGWKISERFFPRLFACVIGVAVAFAVVAAIGQKVTGKTIIAFDEASFDSNKYTLNGNKSKKEKQIDKYLEELKASVETMQEIRIYGNVNDEKDTDKYKKASETYRELYDFLDDKTGSMTEEQSIKFASIETKRGSLSNNLPTERELAEIENYLSALENSVGTIENFLTKIKRAKKGDISVSDVKRFFDAVNNISYSKDASINKMSVDSIERLLTAMGKIENLQNSDDFNINRLFEYDAFAEPYIDYSLEQVEYAIVNSDTVGREIYNEIDSLEVLSNFMTKKQKERFKILKTKIEM